MNSTIFCWCGNKELDPYSEAFSHCPVCETLIWIGASLDFPDNMNDKGYYGRRYWYEHQVEELSLPDINSRSRTDIIERCLYWLRSLLAYRLPPASVLELGSAHGAFVALLNLAGYDALGLEISPSIAEFASRTFQAPTLIGPVEGQQIPLKSLDVIVLLDVLEHLPHPEETLIHCKRLLKDDGLFLIQTPRYPAGQNYEALIASSHPFVRMLIPQEHIYLFSEQAIKYLFTRLEIQNISFIPAIFNEHDMFLIASQIPQVINSIDCVSNQLLDNLNGRIVLALLDLHSQIDLLKTDRAVQEEKILSYDQQVRQLQSIIVELNATIAQQSSIRYQLKTLYHLPYNVIRKLLEISKESKR